MSNDREIFIEVRNLHQRFGGHRVLRGVNLEIYRGETLCILGGSGGGKSVLIKYASLPSIILPCWNKITVAHHIDRDVVEASKRTKCTH